MREAVGLITFLTSITSVRILPTGPVDPDSGLRTTGTDPNRTLPPFIPFTHSRSAKRCAAIFSEDDTQNRLRSGAYGTWSAEKTSGKRASRSADIECVDGIKCSKTFMLAVLGRDHIATRLGIKYSVQASTVHW